MNVLIADDDDSIRQVLALMLYTLGNKYNNKDIRINEVRNGLELSSRIEPEHSYDLIITDNDMPGRKGLDVLIGLRERKDYTPAIIFTGNPLIIERLEETNKKITYGNSNAKIYSLNKPAGPRDLEEVILMAKPSFNNLPGANQYASL